MNYTINEIPDEAVELSGNEMIPIWQGETKKVSVATLARYVQDASSYSTTETLTGGKWIDGKPIYRRVIECTNITVGDNTTVATLADYATIDYITFKYDAVISATPHAKTTGFFSRLEEGGTIVLKIEYVSDTGKFLGISQSRTFSKIYITIEYTKTTD